MESYFHAGAKVASAQNLYEFFLVKFEIYVKCELHNIHATLWDAMYPVVATEDSLSFDAFL